MLLHARNRATRAMAVSPQAPEVSRCRGDARGATPSTREAHMLKRLLRTKPLRLLVAETESGAHQLHRRARAAEPAGDC